MSYSINLSFLLNVYLPIQNFKITPLDYCWDCCKVSKMKCHNFRTSPKTQKEDRILGKGHLPQTTRALVLGPMGMSSHPMLLLPSCTNCENLAASHI